MTMFVFVAPLLVSLQLQKYNFKQSTDKQEESNKKDNSAL